MGTAYRSRKPALAGMRYFLVKGYHQFVIVYRPLPDSIEVLHYYRGERDWMTLLEDE